MHPAQPLRYVDFGSFKDPLVEIEREVNAPQAQYLRCYLHDLRAVTVVIEPNYFDRDYLAEFAEFYATTSAGYANICERAHYFSIKVDRALFRRAVGGNDKAIAELQEAYLGHIVLRPLPRARLGRTVVRAYPDDKGEAEGTPRVLSPRRTYEAHVAGLTLSVKGLAWQQQDSGVGSCATVALWSMLHASAFDDHHAISTTAEITKVAAAVAGTGRAFPADEGLRVEQMLEVIKRHDLAPVIIPGDVRGKFSRTRFSTLVASFVRSGYPILVNGDLDDGEGQPGGHAICIVGFRSPTRAPVPDGEVAYDDANVDIVYLHDDNLGPNARFRVVEVEDESETTIDLKPEAPAPTNGNWPTTNPTEGYGTITPTELVVAVHQELRTAPLALQKAAMDWSAWLPDVLDLETKKLKVKGEAPPKTGMLVGTRFLRLRDYLDQELKTALQARPPRVLADARLQLWEKVSPMSLHIGLVRASHDGMPMMDILFDTSDSDRHLRPTAYIAYHENVQWLLERFNAQEVGNIDLGRLVRAW